MEPLIQKQSIAQVRVNSFIQSVYNWMAIGLALTGVVAYLTANSQFMMRLIYGTPFLMFGLIIAELVMVWSLAARVHRMSASKATGFFLVYSALNGLTLSYIFLVYAKATIASVFFICSLTFLACSVFGWITKRDLTGIGHFMFMGLIGIIIASLINLFFRSPGMSMIISYLGVFIFVGLTAYDTQKLKMMAYSQPDGLDAAVVRKGAILGALTLYLDFINMFIFLLHIFGGNRD